MFPLDACPHPAVSESCTAAARRRRACSRIGHGRGGIGVDRL